MTTDVHIRITLTRGTKVTSSMNPLFNVFGCVLLVVAEFKPVGNAATYDNSVGIKLITCAVRRNSPSYVDSKIHHCNMLNNILPKIQANQCGAADALMLDGNGYVSETNATNVFMVKNGVVYTPTPDFCLPGVTRRTVIDMVAGLASAGMKPVVERNISLAEFHSADEVFTTGSMGELTPVVEIDGRKIGYSDDDSVCGGDVNLSKRRPVTTRLQQLYRLMTEKEGVVIE
jgi:branched-subunit amino acid aminotransferase/4-amino-4-deoxychorismate lyase